MPTNLSDLLATSGWSRPEIYLDPQVRNGISTFAKILPDDLKQGINRLATDINNGVWLEQYKYLLKQKKYDAGYLILVTK